MPLAVDSWSLGFGEKDTEAYAGLTPGRRWTPAAPSSRSEQRPHERPAGEGLRVRIVADYICPWCYIGMARAERLARELPVVLEPWPYELMPHLPPGGLSRELALGRRYPRQYYERLGEQAREEGLSFRLPERLYNTHLAHQAALFAEAVGRGWEMHRALYCAYWGEGEDIGDRDVLCRLAEGLRAGRRCPGGGPGRGTLPGGGGPTSGVGEGTGHRRRADLHLRRRPVRAGGRSGLRRLRGRGPSPAGPLRPGLRASDHGSATLRPASRADPASPNGPEGWPVPAAGSVSLATARRQD